MSGGSDRGSAKPKAAEPAAATTTTPGTVVPPFIGDSGNMLAQQLAAGGFGDPTTILAQLMQNYAPMTMPGTSTVSGAAPSTGGSGTSKDEWWRRGSGTSNDWRPESRGTWPYKSGG